ncbi:unnamed protein product [Spirodela intermedia]|uniref:Uncharacterized protein n=1 Tax=Spirodela intermedia TaxID=51605 RepID=A0A7I8IH57_SPIIN|nr:unnamed protein product [Spirodela intermedia]CAA6657122.1 unnamed protein product [Spirodela intermedia]
MAPRSHLLVATAAAVAVMLVFFPMSSEASQLNTYEGPAAPATASTTTTAGPPTSTEVTASSVDCTNGFPYQSIKQTDTAP